MDNGRNLKVFVHAISHTSHAIFARVIETRFRLYNTTIQLKVAITTGQRPRGYIYDSANRPLGRETFNQQVSINVMRMEVLNGIPL